MLKRVFATIAIVAQIAACSVAQEQPNPDPTTPEKPPMIQLDKVPEFLRMHLPILGRDRGLLVLDVTEGTAAHRAGLRRGDILLEAGGRGIAAQDPVGSWDTTMPIVVLRRGRTQVLNPMATGIGWMADTGEISRFLNRVESSAFGNSGNSRAVSISRAGDQVSLSLSLPEIVPTPIQMTGTLPELYEQLETSELPEAAKVEVRSALQSLGQPRGFGVAQ